MSAAVKYYNTHKDKVLLYKKEWYCNKTKNYAFFKNIKIKGYSKRQSKEIIKEAINKNILRLSLIAGDEFKEYSLDEFMNLYNFKDFSIIELDCFASQYIKEECHYFHEHLSSLDHVAYTGFINMQHIKLQLEIFENQINKI